MHQSPATETLPLSVPKYAINVPINVPAHHALAVIHGEHTYIYIPFAIFYGYYVNISVLFFHVVLLGTA